MRRTPVRPRRGRALAVALVLVAGGAGAAAAAPSSLPTTPPTDARLAKLTVMTKTYRARPTSTRGFNGFQTIVVTAPAGRQILQGFATITGGNTGSSLIQSTQTVGNRRFLVRLIFPGTQGTPGTVHVQVQLLPRE